MAWLLMFGLPTSAANGAADLRQKKELMWPHGGVVAGQAAEAERSSRLRLALQVNENCEATFRPTRRPSHPLLPVALVPRERGTKGSLIQRQAGGGAIGLMFLRVVRSG